MTQTERYQDLPLEEVIGDRFGRYSKYIIQDRALPDARDGLKTRSASYIICNVQRRKYT